MAQQDKLHIGDSQNSQWWGDLQGLFINSLANQYLEFSTDTTFRSLINQNQPYAISHITKGKFAMTNRLNVGNLQFLFFSNDLTILSNGMANFTTAFSGRTSKAINLPPLPNMCHSICNYDGLRVSNTSFNSSINGVRLPMLNGSGNPDLLFSDTLYDNNNFRLGLDFFSLTLKTCVVRDLCFYTSQIPIAEFRKKYHELPLNTTVKFCEWKMSQFSDFYTFGGNLYARNTGTSGNTNQDGTGYDMQLIGYNLNTPIFQSIY